MSYATFSLPKVRIPSQKPLRIAVAYNIALKHGSRIIIIKYYIMVTEELFTVQRLYTKDVTFI